MRAEIVDFVRFVQDNWPARWLERRCHTIALICTIVESVDAKRSIRLRIVVRIA
jgi:hypothetical protein